MLRTRNLSDSVSCWRRASADVGVDNAGFTWLGMEVLKVPVAETLIGKFTVISGVSFTYDLGGILPFKPFQLDNGRQRRLGTQKTCTLGQVQCINPVSLHFFPPRVS